MPGFTPTSRRNRTGAQCYLAEAFSTSQGEGDTEGCHLRTREVSAPG